MPYALTKRKAPLLSTGSRNGTAAEKGSFSLAPVVSLSNACATGPRRTGRLGQEKFFPVRLEITRPCNGAFG